MTEIPKPKIPPVAMRENVELEKIPKVSNIASTNIGSETMMSAMVSRFRILNIDRIFENWDNATPTKNEK